MLRVNLGGAALEGLWLDRRPDIGDGGAKKKKKKRTKTKDTDHEYTGATCSSLTYCTYRVNLGGTALEGLQSDCRLDIGGGGANIKEKHGPKEKETVK